MTIIEALQWANGKLKKAGVDSSMLDAEILLARTLDVRKSWLFSHFNEKLKTHQKEQFHILIDRRANREPLAYILGEKDFYSRKFAVTPSVLIPRPATESMVEKALELIAEANPDRTLIIDVGTGSGAIAITLAAETKQHILAIDIDQQALSVAKENAISHNTEDKIEFQHGNLLEPVVRLFKTLHKTKSQDVSSIYPFDTMIVCANLPYLKEDNEENMQPEVARYEPEIALYAGTDGLSAYWELFKQLNAHRRILPRKTHVIMEIDPDQKHRALQLVTHHFPTSKPEILKDLQGNDRFIFVQC